MLAQIDPSALASLPGPHLVVANYKRIQALLRLSDNPELARALLEESLEIFDKRLGSAHSATQRVRAELARAATNHQEILTKQ